MTGGQLYPKLLEGKSPLVPSLMYVTLFNPHHNHLGLMLFSFIVSQGKLTVKLKSWPSANIRIPHTLSSGWAPCPNPFPPFLNSLSVQGQFLFLSVWGSFPSPSWDVQQIRWVTKCQYYVWLCWLTSLPSGGFKYLLWVFPSEKQTQKCCYSQPHKESVNINKSRPAVKLLRRKAPRLNQKQGPSHDCPEVFLMRTQEMNALAN